MTNLKKKNPKILILGPFWALFAQIWEKINFSEKAFKYSNYLTLALNQKKLMSHS